MTEKTQSLHDMLKLMADFDEGASDMSMDDMKELVGDILSDKVDDCQLYLSYLQSRSSSIGEAIEDMQASKRGIDRTIDNYKKYLDYSLESTGSKKIPGNKYVLSRTVRSTVISDVDNVDSSVYIELNMLRDNVVERHYKINMSEFKKLCEQDENIREKYSKVEQSSFIQFRPNRGIK